MDITNIKGTSDNKCKCGGWLKHWENFSGQKPLHCSVTGCLNTDLDGAHVQSNSIFDNKWYIVPLCSSHNNASGILRISDTVKLVPANVNLTCGKI